MNSNITNNNRQKYPGLSNNQIREMKAKNAAALQQANAALQQANAALKQANVANATAQQTVTTAQQAVNNAQKAVTTSQEANANLSRISGTSNANMSVGSMRPSNASNNENPMNQGQFVNPENLKGLNGNAAPNTSTSGGAKRRTTRRRKTTKKKTTTKRKSSAKAVKRKSTKRTTKRA